MYSQTPPARQAPPPGYPQFQRQPGPPTPSNSRLQYAQPPQSHQGQIHINPAMGFSVEQAISQSLPARQQPPPTMISSASSGRAGPLPLPPSGPGLPQSYIPTSEDVYSNGGNYSGGMQQGGPRVGASEALANNYRPMPPQRARTSVGGPTNGRPGGDGAMMVAGNHLGDPRNGMPGRPLSAQQREPTLENRQLFQ